MATRTAGAAFDVASFAWSRDKFTLIGSWTNAEGLGPVTLLVTIDGDARRLEAEGGRIAEDGPRWGARFRSPDPPDPGTPIALDLAGQTFALPAPQTDTRRFAPTVEHQLPPTLEQPVAPPPPPAPSPVKAAQTDELAETRQLLEELRQERRAVEAAIGRLADERHAAEKLQERLAAGPKRTPLPKKTVQSDEPVDYTPAYWVGGIALLLFFLVMIWIF